MLICVYPYELKKALLLDGENAEEISDSLILKNAKGGLMEALVADMLIKNGCEKLYFFSSTNRTLEIEFILLNEKGILPIEVKAGKKSATKSLNKVLLEAHIPYGYQLANQNIGVADKKITMPLYMAMFL